MAIALIWLTYCNNGKNSATRMKCSKGGRRQLSKYWHVSDRLMSEICEATFMAQTCKEDLVSGSAPYYSRNPHVVKSVGYIAEK
jgi:hypothetical protein